MIGYPIGLKHATRADPPARRGYAVGAIVAVAGALLAPMTVRLGAEDSTIRYDEGGYGGTGQFATQPGGKPGVLELPAVGRYAIMAVGPTPKVPDCVVLDGGQARRPVERVSIPPGDYGGDAATFAWVATFEVPGPGTYTMTCHDQGGNTPSARYRVSAARSPR
nr:hypothetical protein GCM10020092_087730 [Actinoplanes digitatis]